MKNFSNISEFLHYYLDTLKPMRIPIKLERFDLDGDKNVIAIYRVGRQKLLNKLPLKEFEMKYFDKLSHYDQHRVTKFSTFQDCLKLYGVNSQSFTQLVNYILKEVKNEQLF